MAPSAVSTQMTADLTSAGIKKTLSETVSSTEAHPTLAELDASLLTYNYTTSPRTPPERGNEAASKHSICSDHMITAAWDHQTGWEAPELKPYGPLSLYPTASCLQYATECFEGLKLYRGYDGNIRLFRPDCNARRMLISSTRIALPGFNPDELLKLIVKLCAVDGAKWLPRDQPGRFIYIRPYMIGTDASLGVQKPRQALLNIILAYMPVMDANKGGLRLLASQDDMVRAWPGGFGFAKVGANYGPSLLAQGEARARGYDQVLWLLGQNGRIEVTEAGASNFFIVWRTKEGAIELVTAPIGNNIILDGVTRRSLLQMARERLEGGWEDIEKLTVVERTFEMKEIVEAVSEGRVVEAFTAGTAFFVAPVSAIHFKDQDLSIPMNQGDSGLYAGLLKGWLKGIMYGKEKHEWGLVVEEQSSEA